MPDTPTTRGPFGPIALSLSGGGVRAVGYHLGTLSYLDHLGLREDISILSTVSGGSFVGLSYAVALKEGTPFQDYFNYLVTEFLFLRTTDAVLKILARRKPPSPSGRRNFITALAQMYDEVYFKGRRFDMFWEPEPRIHLRELVFNATEFKTGLAFRFQKSDLRCRSGNELVWLEEEHARQTRLADIMAASSDIPGGLEPLFFPEDFHWPEDTVTRRRRSRPVCDEVHRFLKETVNVPSVALMDGGVYDNQGTASVLLAGVRQAGVRHDFSHRPIETSYYGTLALLQGRQVPPREEQEREEQRLTGGFRAATAHECPRCGAPMATEDFLGTQVDRCTKCDGVWFDTGEVEQLVGQEPAFGMYIISDAPLASDPVYDARPTPPPGHLRLGWINNLLLTIVTLGFGYAGLLILGIARPGATGVSWIDQVNTGITIALVLLFSGLTLFLRNRILDAMPGDVWNVLKGVTVREFLDMLTLRLTSLFAMSNDIFMNRIRFMGYALMYGQSTLRRKLVPNEIETLTRTEGARLLPEWMEPTPQMKSVIVPAASRMGTQFWFDRSSSTERNQLEQLVACGQFTTCYNLLKHIYLTRRDAETGAFESPEIERIFAEAKADWLRFKRDAYWLYDLITRGEKAEPLPDVTEPVVDPIVAAAPATPEPSAPEDPSPPPERRNTAPFRATPPPDAP